MTASRSTRSSRLVCTVAAVAVLAVAGWCPAAELEVDRWASCQTYDPETGEPRIDALCFFDALVDRYRSLSSYEDVADVRQTTRRDGQPPREVETRIGCEVENGELRINTPRATLTRQLGLRPRGPARRDPAIGSIMRQYDLWLAPHMALKFTEEPTRRFRAGVDEGFTATEAETVTIGDRSMVHLELQSGDGQQDEPTATFDLYINPESMLVERIKGQQRLPDGAEYTTTLDITPLHVGAEKAPAAPRPAKPAGPPRGTTIGPVS